MLCAHNVIIVKMDWLVYALRMDRGLVKVYPLPCITLYVIEGDLVGSGGIVRYISPFPGPPPPSNPGSGKPACSQVCSAW